MMYNSWLNIWEFVIRAIVWGGFGALHGRRGSDLARLAIGGPVLEQLTGSKLQDMVTTTEFYSHSVSGRDL